MKKIAIFYFFILAWSSAFGQQTSFGPYVEDGWWFNPAESGRGFNIELQDDTIFIAVFAYDDSGRPEWYSGGGRFDASTRTFEAQLDRFEGGQCISCDYRPPTRQVGFAGPITIRFTTPTRGELTWAGGTIPIERFDFVAQFAGDPLNFLVGSWHLTALSPQGQHTGDILLFTTERVTQNGIPFLTGGRVQADSSRSARGGYEPDSDTYVMVVDDSRDFFATYRFNMTKDDMKGCFELVRKGSDPAGTCQVFYGTRIASASRISGSGPFKAAQSQRAGTDLRNDLNWLLYAEQQQAQKAATLDAQGAALALIEQLLQ